eukprot:6203499-Pleurochrysis_carterae.AAC.1
MLDYMLFCTQAWAVAPLQPQSLDRVHSLANDEPPALKAHKKAVKAAQLKVQRAVKRKKADADRKAAEATQRREAAAAAAAAQQAEANAKAAEQQAAAAAQQQAAQQAAQQEAAQ